ncbi:hypothetical protein CWR48_16095 [Oceanobacillus arenosus]|uniref:DUF4179 domain-containing protein n=1 Tax=Oceanobacillus arenosus TaxID=1229153 RepID=A0A3D8PKJ5_9BACI|nr:DUF4179 domain-containing protein [Oceanobacillus arenosus]RDW16564.1 hypothetical protein CWR48_16095 [Oceanobacillus arenosus]
MVAVILISLITSIRVSPVFASYLANVPGMEKVVELIRHDKGMVAAIQSDYYESLGVSKLQNGVEVVIDGVIADEQGVVLFYTINTEEKKRSITLNQAEIRSEDGREIDIASSSYNPELNEVEFANSFHGVLEYFFQAPLNTTEFALDLKVGGETFNIPFTLTKEQKENKTYNINETVTVEGQEITFLDVTINPLRVAVHVKMNPNNTKKFLSFDEMLLVDEHGESWSKIENGITASYISDNEWMLYLQSNYFKEPKELNLVLGKIQAIDKEESMVIVDAENEVIIRQPKRNLFKEVVREGDYLVFKYNEEFPYSFFSQSYDADGKALDSGSSFTTTSVEKGTNEFGYHIEHLLGQKSPISLKLDFFPEWITSNEKIKIK